MLAVFTAIDEYVAIAPSVNWSRKSTPMVDPVLRAYAVAAQAKAKGRIDEGRELVLKRIASDIAVRLKERSTTGSQSSLNLNFICTHNSRRSHLAAVSAAVAARCYGLPGDAVETFSAGTVATAVYPSAVASMKRAGFVVTIESEDVGGNAKKMNPLYAVSFGAKSDSERGSSGSAAASEEDAAAVAAGTSTSTSTDTMRCWSKAYTDDSIKTPFIAIMVCGSADTHCPYIPAAESRHALTFVDPKAGDGTPTEMQGYEERLEQIMGELMHIFMWATTSRPAT